MNYEEMKSKLCVWVIPKWRNVDLLKVVPYEEDMELAIVCVIEIEKDTRWQMVTNSMLAEFGITQDQLFADAKKMTQTNAPAVLRKMSDAIAVAAERAGASFDALDGIQETSDLYVATTECGAYGAGVIFYPGFLESVAEKIGSGFYVLPSSIHEVIILSDKTDFDPMDLIFMVKEVNKTEVAPGDRLSDGVRHYDLETKELTLCYPF